MLLSLRKRLLGPRHRPKFPEVEAVRAGNSYILDIPSEELASLVKKGLFTATTNFARAGQCDVLNICVPTPLNKTRDPDMSSIVSAFLELRKRIRRGQLFILSSTTYPGTTSELVLPMLNEVAAKKGLKVGRDFFLAFSPERIDPGNKKYNVNDIPKVVGGITKQCVRASKAFYSQIVKRVIPVSSTSCAETVKLLENTFRSINIGLVNEVAIMCDKLGINVWEVIEAASSKPYGFMPFYPGPAWGVTAFQWILTTCHGN
jgi:UDP-N-acetyl-D-glucosamine dehydrogenase